MDEDIFFVRTKDNELFLKDKIVLVNGLSSDIGIAIGNSLISNGAFVAGTYCKNKNKLDLLKHSKIKAYKLDLCDEDYEKEIKNIVGDVFKLKGKIDILINVAGTWLIKPFLYETREERERIWKINYEGPFVFAQETIRKMISTGGGDIINIASTTGVRGGGQLSSYAASKAALINLTASLAEEFGPRNIKVNVISPGTTDTKALDSHLDFVSKELLIKNIPRTRLCKPEDVANSVLGILMNNYMTGTNIILHGGKL